MKINNDKIDYWPLNKIRNHETIMIETNKQIEHHTKFFLTGTKQQLAQVDVVEFQTMVLAIADLLLIPPESWGLYGNTRMR